MGDPRPDERTSVVMIVFNGRHRIGRALAHLCALPERPPIVVVDNGSTDGTADFVAARFPAVSVIRLPVNLGAAGRNVGVAAVTTPYVAFAEDDSWYVPGALVTAADLLDRHLDVVLINAQVLVGPHGTPDPLHADMVGTAIGDRPGLPGYRILSFLEGASIVRRRTYETAGGFDPALAIGGPEEHLAADLLTAGGELRYVPSVRVRHWPDHREPPPLVRRRGLRNTLWFAWGRRPLRPALRWTAHAIGNSPRNSTTLLAVLDAIRGLPRVLRRRRLLPPAVERDMARLDLPKMRSQARRYGR